MATVNDIVLIYLEESPVSFARIESILPDAKKDWYHIKLLMLQVPLQVVTWILKDDYINGDEFFMSGKQMKLKKVECPIEELSPSVPPDINPMPEKNDVPADAPVLKTDAPPKKETESQKSGKIISFADLKNKDRNEPA